MVLTTVFQTKLPSMVHAAVLVFIGLVVIAVCKKREIARRIVAYWERRDRKRELERRVASFGQRGDAHDHSTCSSTAEDHEDEGR